MGRPARWARRVRRGVAAGVLALGLGSTLVGCSAVHNSLGTSDAPCFVALPTAASEVGPRAHFDGVRLLRVAAIPYARLRRDIVAAGTTTGRVCLVAYSGHFQRKQLPHALGRAQGRFAVVVLRYPSGRLVVTVLFKRVPVRFAHTHLG